MFATATCKWFISSKRLTASPVLHCLVSIFRWRKNVSADKQRNYQQRDNARNMSAPCCSGEAFLEHFFFLFCFSLEMPGQTANNNRMALIIRIIECMHLHIANAPICNPRTVLLTLFFRCLSSSINLLTFQVPNCAPQASKHAYTR